MSSNVVKTHRLRMRRARRTRRYVRGTAERPRLCVVKTNKYLHVQLVDDANNHTMAACSSASKMAKESKLAAKSLENARKLGEMFGKTVAEKKIERVIFDRGSSKYHGRIAAFADGVRSSGIEF